MDVSIILVNFNTKSLTDSAINSILDKTKDVNFEIILVDNNSTDGSVEHIKKKYESCVKLIESDKNLGFGKANNLGINRAIGKYVFLLNTDTLLINNAIKILFEFMENNKDVGVCGGNLYDGNNKPTHSFRTKLPSLLTLFIDPVDAKLHRNSNLGFNYSNEPKEVGYITGADMMIRKDVLDEVGSFDPDFFMYFEETELTNRIRQLGFKVISLPSAHIVHLEGGSVSKKNKPSRKYELKISSMFLYFEKVYGKDYVKWAYYICQFWNINFFILKRNDRDYKTAKIQYLKWKKKKYEEG